MDQRLCEKPRIKCTDCLNQAFVPMTDDVVRKHLQGQDLAKPGQAAFVAGVYALMPNETCWFLAADFDKQFWQRDALAFLSTCREKRVPAVLERSRSGNGAHVWIFFSEPVPASEARRLGAHLVTETMERWPDIGFDYYSVFSEPGHYARRRIWELIALPLQSEPRQRGNSVFVDDELRPYEDQWAFLSSVGRMSRAEVAAMWSRHRLRDGSWECAFLSMTTRSLGQLPHRGVELTAVIGQMPETVELVLSNQLYISRDTLPPALVNRLFRLAAFQNPEFYAAQAMRLPTFGKPRVVSCAELFVTHISLPRGCLDAALDLLTINGIRPKLRDERQDGASVRTRFQGTLTAEQKTAADALMAHDTGVLAATTAFGKTMVAIKLISQRDRNTLILVHRQQLLDQWLARLSAFLDIEADRIGSSAAEKNGRPAWSTLPSSRAW